MSTMTVVFIAKNLSLLIVTIGSVLFVLFAANGSTRQNIVGMSKPALVNSPFKVY